MGEQFVTSRGCGIQGPEGQGTTPCRKGRSRCMGLVTPRQRQTQPCLAQCGASWCWCRHAVGADGVPRRAAAGAGPSKLGKLIPSHGTHSLAIT